MELMDYLKWRNDVSFRAAPFNEIDNVILSYLAYADFGELLHEEKRHVSIETCFKRFLEKQSAASARRHGRRGALSGNQSRALQRGF